LLVAPHLFPNHAPITAPSQVSRFELLLRMGAGAALTFAVTVAANQFGPTWAGVLAVFPILSTVLAVFSYRRAGAQFTITLLRAMAFGMYSFIAFCSTLAFALPHLAMTAAFGLALLVCLAIQRATQRWLVISR
jgi:hypothetical protein